MTWRNKLITADIVVVLAFAVTDRWLVDDPLGALMEMIMALTPAVAWAFAARRPAWGWSVSGMLLAVLVVCMWVSRVVLSHGPAAPPIDWLLPYLAVSVVICVVAMTVSRSWRWEALAALLTLTFIVAGWAALARSFEGEGEYVPASDAVPLMAGLSIADAGKVECGQDGALCERRVAVSTRLDATEVRTILRSHGWTEDCRPVTGILSNVGLYRYGNRCVSIENREPRGVTVTLLGKADWWSAVERGP